jgi:hypothetical protein
MGLFSMVTFGLFDSDDDDDDGKCKKCGCSDCECHVECGHCGRTPSKCRCPIKPKAEEWDYWSRPEGPPKGWDKWSGGSSSDY